MAEALRSRAPRSDALQAEARRLLAVGHPAAAVTLLQRALAGGDTRVSVVHDLVRAHLAAGAPEKAVNLLGRLVAAAPHRPDLALQLVALLQKCGRSDDALAACLRAAERHPGDLPLWRALARLAAAAGPSSVAAVAARRVCDLDPASPSAWRRLANIARQARDHEALVEATDRWFALAPADPSARHLHAALHGQSPPRAEAGYVADLFDSYADRFDEHLAQLGYRTPEVIAALVAGALRGSRVRRAADLGCGTGQVGAALRHLIDHLDGVDLSEGMLQHAHERGCYDTLTRADLVEFLLRRPATFDVLVSADTLNYLGDLRPVFAAAAAALLPGGMLVASLEEAASPLGAGYRLEPSGRYSHDAGWVHQALLEAGLVAHFERAVLRRESGRDVAGLLFVARREEPGILPMSGSGAIRHASATTRAKE